MIALAPTLFLFSAFVLFLLGALMHVVGRNEKGDEELGWWSSAFLLAGVGALCFAFRPLIETLSVVAGNALFLCSGGLIWAGAVAFAKRPVRPVQALAGGLAWLFGLWSVEIHFRIFAVGILAAIYESLTAYELYSFDRAQRESLLMPRIAAWIVGIQAGVDILLGISGFFAGFGTESSLTDSWVLKYRWLELSAYITILGFILITLSKERIARRHELAAMIDPLTGLSNRRAFERAINQAMKHASRKDTVALLVFDLDNFKEINDRFGHPEGDRVLVAFGETAARNIRSGDILARIGGEEFAALLRPVDRETALAIAERIRAAFIEDASYLAGGLATVSVGVAVVENRLPDLKEMTATADAALYRAKAAGRNRVVFAGP